MAKAAKPITAIQAHDALRRAIHARDRSWTAEMRAMQHGDSITGNRERQTAANWDAKAAKNFDYVFAYLEQNGAPLFTMGEVW